MKIQLTPEQQKRADTLAQMSPSEWDAVCKQCGICCLAKVQFRPDENSDYVKPVYLKQCCEKFDLKTHKCSIYQTRLTFPHCEKVNMDIILNTEILPASCGYVEYIFASAPFSAHVDFNQVRPVPYDEDQPLEQIKKDAIYDSVLWTERCR